MDEQPTKVRRALGAMRDDVWTDLQHRRVAKRIDEALSPPAARAPRRWFVALAAVLAAATLVLVMRTRHARPFLAEGSTLGNEMEDTSAALSDGSKIDVTRGGHVHVVADRMDETRIEVLSGKAEFDVPKRPHRPFVTEVRGVEVRVIGTRFSTEVDLSRPPGFVRVTVHRGVVEVRRVSGDSPARLVAGDMLEVPLGPAPSAGASSTPPAALASDDTSSNHAPPSVTAIAPPPAPAALDASKLFDAARAARATGDIEGAVRSYSVLLKQFPGDERAGVAALELGRLRMDAQHAYRPAAEAFRRAIAAAPNEGVREDALARLVEALDAMHDRESCSKERDRYLQRYPKGVHVSRVEHACGPAL
jgi:TolA-binding protein